VAIDYLTAGHYITLIDDVIITTSSTRSTHKGAMGMMQAIGGVLVPIFRAAAAGESRDAMRRLMDVCDQLGAACEEHGRGPRCKDSCTAGI
jgi:hypothetical protein